MVVFKRGMGRYKRGMVKLFWTLLLIALSALAGLGMAYMALDAVMTVALGDGSMPLLLTLAFGSVFTAFGSIVCIATSLGLMSLLAWPVPPMSELYK